MTNGLSLLSGGFMAEIGSLLLVGLIILLVAIFFSFIPVRLWIAAITSNAKVGLLDLIGMRLRNVKPAKVVHPLIRSTKAGINIPVKDIEAHLLAGGRPGRVVDAIIAAHKAKLELSFESATAIDLAGRDVLEAVKMSVKPKIIETPLVIAVAKNGIEVKALARVTVRANLERLVGGAGEETVIARVGEGIVTTVGSAESHKEVLENPDMISERVLSKGLDSGTAFEILSIDIADIDLGKNIGARLQIEQAEADKEIAQAKAEERRAIAIAQEQEMKAKVEEMRAKVVEAEAEIPLAISEAFRKGQLGVMDYYKLQNIKADTTMRESISEGTDQ